MTPISKRKSSAINKEQNNRCSQASKITSTPRTSNANTPAFSLSPSISSISNNTDNMEIDNDKENMGEIDEIRYNDNSRSNRSSNGEMWSSLETVNDYSKSFSKIKTIKWTGFWASLKPTDRDSLYFKLISQPAEIESIAIDVINLCQKNEKEGIIYVFHFFVQLCGYKKLSLAKTYDYEEGNSKEVIKKMESELIDPELMKTGKFLFMKKSKFVDLVDMAISDFVKYFIVNTLKTELLFDGGFTGHLFEFIRCMSFSIITAIRVTGVIISIRILRVLIDSYSQFLSFLEENVNSSFHGDKIEEKKTMLENYIDFLYMIYDKNCLIPDKKCYLLRIKCAEEIFHWIKVFPAAFIFKRRCLGHLMKLVTDNNEAVRTVALETCSKLINSQELYQHIKERMQLILQIVSGRFLDVDYKIATKAVSIFTDSIDNYISFINSSHIESIVKLVYQKNFLLAKAAGKFLVTYLKNKCDTDENVFLSLSKITFSKEEYTIRMSIFLECCIEFSSELKNWDVIINILLNEQFDFNQRKNALTIMNETMRYSLTGKFLHHNVQHVSESPQSPPEHEAVINAFIPRFKNLVLTFQQDNICLKLLIEILSFINYDHCLYLHQLRKEFVDIFNLLKSLFETNFDPALLEQVCEAFSVFCEKGFNTHANMLIEDIKNTYISTLNEDLKKLSSMPEKNLLIRIKENSLKISILFSKFRLNNMLKWKDIFNIWNINNLKVLKYLVICCKRHLIWDLVHLTASSTNNNNNDQVSLIYFRNSCKEFIYSCIEMLENADFTSESLLVFEAICDYYSNLAEKVKGKRKFDNLIVKIDEPNIQDILLNFLTRYVMDSTIIVNLEKRQQYLCQIVDMIYLEVLPIENFSKILNFYDTRSEEFGAIMDNIIDQLHLAHPALPLLVMHTLAEFYKQILEKYEVVNILSDESKKLKALAKKFASIKYFKSNNDTLKIIHMSINFAFSNQLNYQFLYFTRYFIKNLKEDCKKDAYLFFKENVPKEARNDEIILLFAKGLK